MNLKSPKIFRKILDLLYARYPDAHCELQYETPLQLLVATVLSAQCTDKRVNQVTDTLFEKYPDARSFLVVSVDELEDDIRSTGFFRQKAKSLRGIMERLVTAYAGEVPHTLDELVKLPGVGRKTANVVLGNAFGVPGITVDTHVKRISQRLGFSESDDPTRIEQDLMALFPREEWTQLSHTLIFHGRQTCKSRKPQCGICAVAEHCPSAI